VAALDRLRVAKLVVLRPGGQVVARRHGEPVGHEIGDAEDQDDARRELGPDDAGHDRERRDRAVDAAVDEVTEVAVVGAGGEARADCLVRVLVFQAVGTDVVTHRRDPILWV
jgi:hypothetical protein